MHLGRGGEEKMKILKLHFKMTLTTDMKWCLELLTVKLSDKYN